MCGRSVASLYRDAVHVSLPDASGRRHEYAYLRRHQGLDGQRCPTDTAHLATILPVSDNNEPWTEATSSAPQPQPPGGAAV